MKYTIDDMTKHMSVMMDLEGLIVGIVAEELNIPEYRVSHIFEKSEIRAKMFNIRLDYYKTGWENIYNEFITDAEDKLIELKGSIQAEYEEKKALAESGETTYSIEESPEMSKLVGMMVKGKETVVNHTKVPSSIVGTKLKNLFTLGTKNRT